MKQKKTKISLQIGVSVAKPDISLAKQFII